MTKIDETLISRLEKLARLRLDPEEREIITKDLQDIVNMFDKLQEVDTEGIEAMHHVGEEQDVRRPDEVKNELDQAEALKNVPKQKNGFIAVPKFLNAE